MVTDWFNSIDSFLYLEQEPDLWTRANRDKKLSAFTFIYSSYIRARLSGLSGLAADQLGIGQ